MLLVSVTSYLRHKFIHVQMRKTAKICGERGRQMGESAMSALQRYPLDPWVVQRLLLPRDDLWFLAGRGPSIARLHSHLNPFDNIWYLSLQSLKICIDKSIWNSLTNYALTTFAFLLLLLGFISVDLTRNVASLCCIFRSYGTDGKVAVVLGNYM